MCWKNLDPNSSKNCLNKNKSIIVILQIFKLVKGALKRILIQICIAFLFIITGFYFNKNNIT